MFMRLLPLLALLSLVATGCASTAPVEPTPLTRPNTPQATPTQPTAKKPVMHDLATMSSQAAFERAFPNWSALYRKDPTTQAPVTHDALPAIEGGVVFTSVYLDIEMENEQSPGQETMSFESYQQRLTAEALLNGKDIKLPGAVGASGQSARARQRNWESVSRTLFNFDLTTLDDKAKMDVVFTSLEGRVLFAYEAHTDHVGAFCIFGAPLAEATSTPLATRSIEQLWVVACQSNTRY